MPFSAYDSDAIRLLSAAFTDALEVIRKSAPNALSDGETANLSKQIANNLLTAFDRGERDASALGRAALNGIFAPRTQS